MYEVSLEMRRDFERYRKCKWRVLWYLYHRHIIAGKHTDLRNVVRGLPKHEQGYCLKVAEDLIKKGYIVKKPTRYGIHVSLNKHKIKKIEEYLGL